MGLIKKLYNFQTLAGFVIVAVWALATLLIRGSWFQASLSVLVLAELPGYFLYRTIAGYKKSRSPAKIATYSLGLSLLSLIFVGLLINTFLPIVHIQQPLTTLNLSLGVGGFMLLAIIGAALRGTTPTFQQHDKAYWLDKAKRFIPGILVGLLLPLLTVGGATMLNNGGPNWLALVALMLIATSVLVLAWQTKYRFIAWYPYMLYMVCLSILLGTSMRGWQITGHDVMQEFQVFELTIRHGLWSMHFYQDAYMACLSITILPTIIQKLTGIADPYVFKLIFQIFFAMIAPILYISLRNYIPKKFAFLAAFCFIAFPVFLTDIMMLNRQEIALLFLGLAIQTGLDRELPQRTRNILALSFLSGMVLSHYSTSYVAVSTLIVAMVMGGILTFIRRFFRRTTLVKKFTFIRKQHFTIFRPYVIVATLALVVVWSGPITQTSGNISQTINGIIAAIPQLLSHKSTSSSSTTHATQLKGTTIQRYQQFIATQLRTLPPTDYYPTKAVAAAPVEEIKPTVLPETPLFSKLRIPVNLLSLFYDLGRQAYVGIIVLFISVGVLLIALHKIAKQLPSQYLLLGIASLVVIVMQVILPPDAVNYGFTRVVQQSLLLLSLPAIVAGLWLFNLIKIKQAWQTRVFSSMFVFFFLILSGILPALTGGFKPALALSNSGFYYEAYYTHPDELTAAHWLATSTPKGSRVYADEFIRRTIMAYEGIYPQPTLLPIATPIDSFVYLSDGNTRFNEVPTYFQGNLIFYSIPYGFLNTNKNLLYNSGNVLIYK